MVRWPRLDELERLRERIRDLEAQALAQAAAEATIRERLESVAANAPDYIIEMDRAGVITYMNRPAPGRAMSDMLGSKVEIWMEAGARPAFARTLAHVFEHGEPASYESVGAVTGRYYINRVAPVLVDGGVDRAILITHDVTELKTVELRLRESEEWFRTLVDGYFDAMAVSERGRLIQVNPACAALFGYTSEEMTALSAADLTTPEGAAIVMEHIASGDEASYVVPGRRKDGTLFPANVHGRNVSYRGRPARLTFFRDLSDERRSADERRRLEQQMQDAQKLETLGVLAGGIAHDFNNLLQVILGNLELATLEAGGGPPIPPLAHARDATLRAAELVHQILAYSGKAPRSEVDASVSELVRGTAELLLVSISKNTELTLVLPDGLPDVRIDPAQLRQVVMNLITNGSEALGGKSGRVCLRVGRGQPDPDTLSALAVRPSEPLVRAVFVEVTDDGVGMSEEELRKIFDPFYSTKFAGRGLGLATVAGIVRAHGGAIHVASVPGHGSTFTVYLPASEAAAQPLRAVPDPEPAPARLRGRMLLADDEPRLLQLLLRSLTEAGLTVTTAHDGQRALELCAEDPHAFDVVVLDLTMPRMNGVDALREMRKLRADLPALLLSGYSEVDLGDDLGTGPTLFLSKPFRSDALLGALEALLSGQRLPPATRM